MNHELARRLAAAFISHQLGIGMDYAMKTYVDQSVGAFWLDLAELVSDAMVNRKRTPESSKDPSPKAA